MPLFISMLVVGVIVYCVLDVVLTEPSAIRGLPKPIWLAIVVLLPMIGAALWFLGGRPENAGVSPGSTTTVPGQNATRRGSAGHGSRQVGGRVRPATPAPRGPEDDPEFLKGIEDKLRRERRKRRDENSDE